MNGQLKPPSLPVLSGQLRLGLREETRKITLPEEIFAFAKSFVFYGLRRFRGVLFLLWRTLASGFSLTSGIKLFIQRKLYRKKGQLAFPLAHASLLGVSFSLLFFTSGFGEFLYRETGGLNLGDGVAIVSDHPSVATEESQLLRTEVLTYIVEEGDTLFDLAQRFRVTVDTLAYANNLSDPYTLHPGQELTIPPVEGLVYRVRSGDTVEKIAKKYQADPQRIVEFNYLFSPYDLVAGTELIVPYAQIPQLAVPASSSSGFLETPSGACGPLSLGYPTAGQTIVGGFTSYHRAIDFAANYGDPLYAVADGVVTAVVDRPSKCLSFSKACNYGYGGYVFIDIGGGYQIRYGHISKPLVGVGEHVTRGDVVAFSGESGMAFAPHLHFELLCGKTKINPLLYIH